MTYQETLDWLFKQLPAFQRVGKAAYKANLDNTYAIMDVLNQAHLKFKSIHIAGTNGKGSTAHMLASIFQEAGYKTGLYTSPHLRDFRERIRINGEMISKEKVVYFVEKNQEEFLRIKPSFFEMTVGLAFSYFADEQVDIAIIETGLGGRLDSTNIVSPLISVITNIGKDHMQFLGHSLAEIATEKAGIIKKKIPVIIGEHQERTDQVFIERAKMQESILSFAQDSYQISWYGNGLKIHDKNGLLFSLNSFPLKGNYQLKNVCTTIHAAKSLNIALPFIKKGLENVKTNTSFSGRWDIINNEPLTVCDTAHNEEGLILVMEQLHKMDFHHLHFILAVVDDKLLGDILKLFPKDATYYFCKADIPRGLAVDILAEQASENGLHGEKYNSVQEALLAAQTHAGPSDLVFVGGSTFTVAEVV